MRVIAGSARSLPLKTPPGKDTRPTTDRIKETLFNILQQELPGCVFVDAFAGSGGIGIEALSRGAAKAYFLENDPKAISCIQANLLFTKLADRAIVIKQDVCAGIVGIPDHVDIIFMDPPYDQGHEQRVLAAIRDLPCVTDSTLIVTEASLYTDFSYLPKMGFRLVREKCYKTNRHLFIQKDERG